jgi:hypothetical protein
MTGPDRIYLDAEDGYFPRCFADPKYCNDPAIEYVRRDPAVLAALPEMQALIRKAVEAEREACAKLRAKKPKRNTSQRYALETLNGLDAYDWGWSQSRSAHAAAIRKRGEPQP